MPRIEVTESSITNCGVRNYLCNENLNGGSAPIAEREESKCNSCVLHIPTYTQSSTMLYSTVQANWPCSHPGTSQLPHSWGILTLHSTSNVKLIQVPNPIHWLSLVYLFPFPPIVICNVYWLFTFTPSSLPLHSPRCITPPNRM